MDKKIYQFEKQSNGEKKILEYNGKQYTLNCGYKTLKKVMKEFKKMDENDIESTENLLIQIMGEKAFNSIVDDDFEMEDYNCLFKLIMGIVQGVEPEDMEEFFQGLEE